MCLGNISKDLIINNVKKKRLNEYVYEFSVDYDIIDTSNIMNIHKYLTKKHDIKMLGIIKTIFTVSNPTKYASLSNQKCEIHPTLTNLHLNESVKNFTTIHLRLN